MSKERFVAYVYEDDYCEIQKLVQQYPDIETGGDLFGLWKNERTVIIQQFIGPGKKCKRTSTSFHQDIEYLHKVGSLITTEEGLCNVGEWHSHHQIGMPEPSGADHRTVFSNMPHLGLERFVLFIASIGGKGSSGKRPHDVKLDDIKLRPFLFLGSTQKVVKGEIEIMPGSNPHRLNSRAESEIETGKEPPPKYMEGPQKQGKNKKEAPIITENPKNVPTVKQQAKPSQDAKEKVAVQAHGKQDQPLRETDPLKAARAEPPAQSSSDNESLSKKPPDNQQRKRREKDAERNREGRDSFNNENCPPNIGSAASRGHGSSKNWHFSNTPSNTAAQGGDHGNMPTSASAPLWRDWNNSSQPQSGAAEGRRHVPQTSPASATTINRLCAEGHF